MAGVSSWTEGIIFSLMFLGILSLITVGFNNLYGGNNSIPIADNSGAEGLFITYANTSQQQIEGGEVDFNAQQGITLKSSYGILKDVTKICWSFISGGWIEQIIGAWNLGEAGTILAKGLRILYFLSLVFALLYGLFKVVM